MRTLKDIKCNQSVSVVKLHGEGAVKTQNHGYWALTKGTQVFVRKVAPLETRRGDGAGYELSLRKADAQMIEVQ